MATEDRPLGSTARHSTAKVLNDPPLRGPLSAGRTESHARSTQTQWHTPGCRAGRGQSRRHGAVDHEPGAEVSLLLLDAVVREHLPDEGAEGLGGREVRHGQPLADPAHLELLVAVSRGKDRRKEGRTKRTKKTAFCFGDRGSRGFYFLGGAGVTRE